jgi:hypothetical protein
VVVQKIRDGSGERDKKIKIKIKQKRVTVNRGGFAQGGVKLHRA